MELTADKSSPAAGRLPSDRAALAFDLRRALARIDRIPPRRFAIAVVLGYVALSLFAYLPAWPGDPARLVGSGCACGDPVQQSWFLGWLPWAILHGHNPLLTNWIDFPRGVNLGINTEMPLLGLLAAPITLTAGSVVSFEVLIWLAFPLSATAAFFVLRRWSGSNLGAACGGLLYGFSPYMVGEGFRHLNLAFVPLPPLIFYAAVVILVEQRPNPWRWGGMLGILVTAQYLISPEVLSTTLVVAACAVAILAVARRRAIDRDRLRHAARALVPAVAIPAVVLAWPVYVFFAGPLRYHGPVQVLGNPYRIDLLGPIVPTSAQQFAPRALQTLGDKFTYGFGENGSYLGAALLVLAVWLVVRYRRDRHVLLAAIMAAVAFVLSLGPVLMVANHSTGLPLPFDALGRLPLLDNILPARFSLYEQFFVAVVIALGLARVSLEGAPLSSMARAPEGANPAVRAPAGGKGTAAQLLVLALAAVAVVSLVPAWPTPTTPVDTALPAFFTSPAANEIPAGSVVLTYPLAITPEDQAMLWQETDRYRWKLVGGYALIPNRRGLVSARPPELTPFAVQHFLAWEDVGGRGLAAKRPPALDRHLVAELRVYIRRYGIGTVILDPIGSEPSAVRALFERALGAPRRLGGVDCWFDAGRRAREPVPAAR
jgi:hypothetical protein